MAITLDAITLPEDLSWTDEYSWSPVVQNSEFTLTGALILEEGTQQAGRPITLQSPAGGAWTTRATAEALRAKLLANNDMTLTLHDGRAFTVRWRHGDTPLEAAPVLEGLADPDTDTLYDLTLRLLEI
ncbi:conserved hypothetical protein [Nitrosococcus halophilus Nc 4]|uniref:Uncharacterized protein n=1 Tax=Nitrosococcus halophilus (strain Nc4) TaxID=472759 RepID=D5BYW9_NITHN|nr:hypothetical protein [Nitrosococcus halophilus]ADE14182.1 conserved hypothetical protein [Nitrosococcus halophilus Nc 4]